MRSLRMLSLTCGVVVLVLSRASVGAQEAAEPKQGDAATSKIAAEFATIADLQKKRERLSFSRMS